MPFSITYTDPKRRNSTVSPVSRMELQFVRSQKGSFQLFYDGFLYTVDRQYSTYISWKCVEYNRKVDGRKSLCKGRVRTDVERTVIIKDLIPNVTEHNHPPRYQEARAQEIREEIKKRARESSATPLQIISESTGCVSSAVQGILPQISVLSQSVKRARRTACFPTATPRSLEELDIPDIYRKTTKGENFLVYDSGAYDRHRIILFSTNSDLHVLKECANWFGDGTFKVCPPLFGQVYTIHGLRNNAVLPLAYALLPDKSEETYCRLFRAMKFLCPELNPSTFLSDFEKAQRNAVQREFPDAQLRGCFFHFTQCLWRKIQRMPDLLKQYLDPETDMCIELKKLAALAYVPVEDVVQKFEELISSTFYSAHHDLLQDYINYFEDSWIGRQRSNGALQEPLVATIPTWNQYDSVNLDLPRTNNSIEGWHRRFSSLLSSHHPSIWKFIEGLKKEQSLTSFVIEQYTAGQQPPRSRKAYRNAAENIKKIVSEYQSRNTDDYLRGIAHNFNFQV